MDRRNLLKIAATGVAAAAIGVSLPAGAEAAQETAAASPRSEPAAYNILFILTDQERFLREGELPDGYRLLAHERLARKGVAFENHRIASCVCTSSRSVLYTCAPQILDPGRTDSASGPSPDRVVIALARIVLRSLADRTGLVVPSATPLSRRRIGERLAVRARSVLGGLHLEYLPAPA